MEVTVINRQSYMAEVSSLLGLITDEDTRTSLIAQMEHLFDVAEDEDKLIQEIGNPTKVAVALIRYADRGVVTPTAAAVVAPERAETAHTEPAEPVNAGAFHAVEPPQAAEAEAETPVEAGAEEASDVPADATPVEAEAPAAKAEEPSEPTGEEAPPAEAEAALETALPTDAEAAPEAAAEPIESGTDGEAVVALEAEIISEEEEPDETAEEAALELEDQTEDDFDDVPTEADDDGAPQTITKTNGLLVVLYLIPAIVIGVPVFLALVVLNLALFAIGVGALGAGVGIFATAFLGFSVVADMLLLLGGGASVFAVALVLVWLAIWFLLRVTCGWIRVVVRLGKRFCCKEVEVV